MEDKDKKTPLNPDILIEELGGCGRYQIRLNVLVHLMKTAVCMSFMAIIVSSKTPSWQCIDLLPSEHGVPAANVTANPYSTTSVTDGGSNNQSEIPTYSSVKACHTENGTRCTKMDFDMTITSMVPEFQLVCDMAFVPSTLMSIMTTGMFIGNPLSGQLADIFGRRVPFFSSLAILVTGNTICVFATSWIMVAVGCFLNGLGGAFFLTIQFSLLSEFSLAKWRSWIIGFPSWPVEACLFAFIAWALNDWRFIYVSAAACSAICLLSWWLIPESFRWLLAHNRRDEAEKIIRNIAIVNKHPLPDLTVLLEETSEDGSHGDTKYSFLHMFKTRDLVRITVLSAINWFALGFVYYGLNFGIQALSGNLYLNFLLFNATGIPVKALGSTLANRIGRKKASMLCFITSSIGAFITAILYYVDVPHQVALTNGFAILANMGIYAAYGTVQTMTIELYPTVIRNISFGFHGVICRIGAILGPQMVFLNTFVPGILFFICGIVSVLCTLATVFLPETRDLGLKDTIQKN